MSSATIKLHLRFGETRRLRIVEISNWSGVALAAPRTDFDLLLERDEIARPGVYVLLGEEYGNDRPPAYIGEAENVRERLKQHSGKDFWSHAFVFTDKDENLTKAHIRYLEGRIIKEAKNAGRYVIQNTQGSGAKLPESEMEMAEVYLTWLRQLMPVLGCDLIAGPTVMLAEISAPITASAVEFAQALKKVSAEITPKQREMLKAHYGAPSRRLTARGMAEKVGFASFSASNLQYGRLGRLVGEALGLAEEDCHVGVLVEFIRPKTEGNTEWVWVMRSQLAEALRSIGWV